MLVEFMSLHVHACPIPKNNTHAPGVCPPRFLGFGWANIAQVGAGALGNIRAQNPTFQPYQLSTKRINEILIFFDS